MATTKRTEFGKWLRKQRISKALTQSELAKELGVGNMIVCFWEKEGRKPSMKNIRAIASYFEVKVSDLVAMIEDEEE